MHQRLIKVDHKVRVDHTYPIGFQDVLTIEKTNENFRLLYDVKGRFVAQPITPNEAKVIPLLIFILLLPFFSILVQTL